MIWENLKQAFISLRQAKMRSFLTMLGIIIGVSSVVGVIAVGEGVKKQITGEVSEYGSNLVQINPGQSITQNEEGENTGFNPAASIGASTLTEQDVKSIAGLDYIESVVPVSIISGAPRIGDKSATGMIIATFPEVSEMLKLEMETGRFFNASDRGVTILGYATAQELAGDAKKVLGREVTIRQEKFKVIGITKEKKSEGLSFGASQFNSAVFLPFEDGKLLSSGVANIIEIDAKIDESKKPVKEAVTEMKKLIKANHRGEEDFTILTAEDSLKLFETILNLVTSFVAAIASISLLVGGIGIMNIMLVSVTERTREIGIRKAVGASNRHILLQFLIEAVVISVIGGLLGVGAAYLQGLAVKSLAGITPVIGMDAIILAVGVSTAIGVIFGLAPAIRAMRKRPIQALRYE